MTQFRIQTSLKISNRILSIILLIHSSIKFETNSISLNQVRNVIKDNLILDSKKSRMHINKENIGATEYVKHLLNVMEFDIPYNANVKPEFFRSSQH